MSNLYPLMDLWTNRIRHKYENYLDNSLTNTIIWILWIPHYWWTSKYKHREFYMYRLSHLGFRILPIWFNFFRVNASPHTNISGAIFPCRRVDHTATNECKRMCLVNVVHQTTAAGINNRMRSHPERCLYFGSSKHRVSMTKNLHVHKHHPWVIQTGRSRLRRQSGIIRA